MRALSRDHWFAKRCKACLLPDNIRRGWDPIRRSMPSFVGANGTFSRGEGAYTTSANDTYLDIGTLPLSKMTKATFLLHFKIIYDSGSTFSRILGAMHSGADDIRLYWGSSTQLIAAWDDGSQTNQPLNSLTSGKEYVVLMSHSGAAQYTCIYDVANGTFQSVSGADTFTFSTASGATRLYSSAAHTPGVCNGDFYSLILSEEFVNADALAKHLIRDYLSGKLYAKEPDFYPWMAAAATSITGTIAVTEQDDTPSASGLLGAFGTATPTEQDDTSNASGTVTVTGTIAVTEQDDTPSASGTVGVGGTIAVTEQDDTSSASGTVSVFGTAAPVEEDDTSSASGTVSGGAVTGTIAVSEGDDTSSASGLVTTPSTGTIAVVEDDDVSAAFGIVGVVAAANMGGRHPSLLWQ